MSDRNEQIVDVLIRLSQGDMTARLERTYDLDVGDAIAYCVNLLAVEFDRLLTERERNVRYLADAVSVLRKSFVALAGGDYATRVPRNGTGDPVDELARLFNETAIEVQNAVTAIDEQRGVLEATLESLLDPVLLLDPGGVILRTNGAATDLFMRQQPLLGMRLSELTTEDEAAFVSELPTRVGRAAIRDRDTGFRIAGGEATLPVSVNAYRDAEGNVSGIVLVIRKALSAAHRGSDRVRQIVQDLQAFSVADRETVGPVDVNGLVHTVLAMLENEIRHHATVVLDLGEIPPVDGNEAKLGQVLINLVHNAAQSIPSGRVSENTIRITTATDASGRVVVSVQDTGQGIESRHLGRIFDAFYTTKPVGVGSGLGLAICHKVVSKLGGTISVDSEVGKGTTFTLTLPPSARPVTSEGAPTPEPAPVARGRVLVIDDEIEVGQSVRRILRRRHDVDAVQRAHAALELLESTRYDAILCDVMMPEMTGIAFHDRLKTERPELAGRVVFMSGGAFSPEARTFLGSHSGPIVEKPFEAQALRVIIDEVVGHG